MHESTLSQQLLNGRLASFSLIPAPEPDRQGPWCAMFWAEWLMEPDKNEESLRKYTKPILGAFQEASWRNDIKAMDRMLALLDFGYPYCTEEPFLTPFELALMYMLYVLADRHLIDGRLDACLSDLEKVEACLETGDIRRAQVGMVPRPNSELRLDVLGLRAGCLADPTGQLPSLAQARTLAASFWSIADAVFEKLQLHSEALRIRWNSKVALREMEICKLAYKLDDEFFGEAVQAFNRRYDADLATEAPREVYEEQLVTSWFWDMEVWKHLHAPVRNHRALDFCIMAREATRPLHYGKSPADCLRHYWKRQASSAA